MPQDNQRDDLLRNYLMTGILVVAAFVIGYLFSEVRNLKSNAGTQPNVQAGDQLGGAPTGPTVTLASIIEEAGANPDNVQTCMDNNEFTEAINAEIDGGEAAGVGGTPGNFVLVGTQGEALPGAVPFEQLKPVLDQYLAEGQTANTEDLSIVPAVTDADHVRGPANAKITIVEYSDFDCPFCARFHETMNQVMEEYDGQVRWVYRDFPLPQLHPNAMTVSEAAECIAAQNGEDAFWSFADAYYAAKSSGANVTL